MSIGNNYSNPYSGYSSSLGGSSSLGSSTGASDINFSNGYQPVGATNSGESTGGAKKSGGIGGFFKGIFNGAKNAVKSLFTPKGLLMAGAGLAACIAFPVAAPLVLGGLAVAAGGSKMVSAAKSGDSEQMGEGFFTAGTGVLGAVGSGAVGSVLNKSSSTTAAAEAGTTGGAATEAGTSGSSGGFFSNLSSKFTGMTDRVKGYFSPAPKPTPTPVEETPAVIPPVQEAAVTGGETTATRVPTVESETIPGRSVPGEFPGSPTIEPVTIPARHMPGAWLDETPAATATTGERAAATEGTPTPAVTEEAATNPTTTTTETAPADKPGFLQAPRTRLSDAWSTLRGKMPPAGGIDGQNPPPGVFTRTGQVFQQPSWSLPATASLASGQGMPGSNG